MTQPRWARTLKRRKTRIFKPGVSTATGTVMALHDITRRGNRRPLSDPERSILAELLVGSTPPHQEDPYTQGFIRRTTYYLRKGRNLFAQQAKTALLTIHDWHKDEEIADLATGALEDLYPDPETWYL